MLKKIMCLFSLLLNLFFYSYSYAEISVSINNSLEPNQTLTTDDIIELKIIVDSSNKDRLDLSSLNKDFTVLGKAQQVYHSIINGQASSKIQWLISMQAKKAGSVIIPKITVGQQSSRPITLNIKETSVDPNSADEIFVTVESNTNETYINSPVKVTANIYVSSKITPRNLSLSVLDSNDATSSSNPNVNIQKTDDFSLYRINESNKQVFYNNKRYQLYQVQHLAYYSKEGKLQLPKFTLSGLKLKENGSARDIFSLYQQQWQPFNRNSQEITITVKPKPGEFGNSPWIVADNIAVQQEWSNSDTNISIGDALQRTIIINGKNIPADNLPVLFNSDVSNSSNDIYKIYIDKPERENKIENDHIISTLSQRITYIPTKNGSLDLPQLDISWWNNKTKSKIDTVIEGKSFTIKGNAPKNNASTTPDAETNIVSSNSLTGPAIEKNSNSKLIADVQKQTGINKLIYILISIIILLVFIIIALILKLKKYYTVKYKNNTSVDALYHTDIKTLKAKLDLHLKNIKALAINKDAHAVYKAICLIADLLYPNCINSSTELQKQVPEASQKALNHLSEAVYSNQSKPWDNIDFINYTIPALEQLIYSSYKNQFNKVDYNSDSKKNYNKKLPELYPKY